MSGCSGCGAALRAGARFCGECGAATRSHARAVAARARGERATTWRAAAAFAVTCCGPFAAMLAIAAGGGGGEEDGDGWTAVLVHAGALLLAAAVAAALLRDVRATFPLRTAARWLLAAVPVAALTLALAIAYVALLPGAEPTDEDRTVTWPHWLAAVALAPVTEELLCRGASWRAASTMSSPRLAVTLTAVVFAFLHGLGGGYLLELPHRFVVGIALGWLRWRSGSVLPGVIAHVLHNLGAVVIAR